VGLELGLAGVEGALDQRGMDGDIHGHAGFLVCIV
jgi:hypothetical protein